MTRYAFDRARNALTAQWSTGIGDAGITVAELPRPLPHGQTLRLADALTELSLACWRCYTHPAGAADSHGPRSLGWYRQQERDAFTTIPGILTASRPPADVSAPPLTRVEHAAHAVARTLRALDDLRLTGQITADVAAELAAVDQAECGDLSKRAQQATALSREDASPLHVAEADTLLRDQPFGGEALLTRLDPGAAAIAAAHWLHAVVTVTARHTHLHPAQVVALADHPTKPLATESLTDIVTVIDAGARPWPVVMSMIRNALHVADGHLRGIAETRHRMTAAEHLLEKARADHPELDLPLSADTVCIPLTPLDPTRPAPDLLDNLLFGIRSCWRLYERYATIRRHRTGPGESADRLRETFLAAIRHEATARSERLL